MPKNPTQSSSGGDDGPKKRKTVKFYRQTDPHYYLTNFYGKHIDKDFKLRIDGKEWPSSEHYYHAMKFRDYPEYSELIRTCDSPGKAKVLGGQKYWGQCANWKHSRKNRALVVQLFKDSLTRKVTKSADFDPSRLKIQKKVVLQKFLQNKHLAKKLVGTGDSILIENSPTDYYWGCGRNGTGENNLGKILEEVRNELREREEELED